MEDRLQLIRNLHRAGRLHEAEAGYRACLRSGETEAGAPLAALLLQQQRYGEAVDLLVPLARAEPSNAQLAINLSVALRRSGRNDEALQSAQRACALAPASAASWNALGLAALELGQLAEALQAFDAGLHVAPGQTALTLHRAHALRRLGHAAEAHDLYSRLTSGSPGLLDAWRGLATVQAQLGQAQAALHSRERALAIAPENPELRLEHAVALLQAGDAGSAATQLTALLRIDAHDAQAWAWLGRAQLKLGDVAAARATFEQARARNATDAVIAHFHAALSGQLPEAVESEYIRELFDDFAERFERTLVERLGYDAPAQLARFLRDQHAEDGAAVLDLGCGTGLIAPHLARPGRFIDGVDLSPRMLEHARAKGLYRDLHAAELTDFLRTSRSQWDLVVATDVFIYVAELRPVFDAVWAQLAPRGCFAFSIECSASDRTELLPATGRYRHAPGLVQAELQAAGFVDVRREAVTLRLEAGHPVAGELVLARGWHPLPGERSAVSGERE